MENRDILTQDLLIVTSQEALGELVGRSVTDAIREILPQLLAEAQRPEFYTRKEAAAVARRSVRAIDYARKQGTLAFIKRGGRVLIPSDALHEWLGEGFVPAKSGPEAGVDQRGGQR